MAPREIEKSGFAVCVISASRGSLSRGTCISEPSDVEAMMLITVSAMCPRGPRATFAKALRRGLELPAPDPDRIGADWNLGKLLLSLSSY